MYLIFFCGYLKSRVYFNRSNNLKDLRQRISTEMEQVCPDSTERGVFTFLCECQIHSWQGQFQHLRYILSLTLDVCLFLFEVN
jgi:hypothetical protein